VPVALDYIINSLLPIIEFDRLIKIIHIASLKFREQK